MAKTPTTSPEEHEESQSRMTFGEHLDELRKRLLRAAYGGLFGVGICVYFMFDIYNIVTRPYVLVADHHGVLHAMNAFKPQEAFFTPLTLAIKAGLILTSPWIIYQLWQFVASGLYKKERKVIYRYIAPSAILFLMGVAFFYFIVLPLTLEFFFSFSAHAGISKVNPNWWERTLTKMTSGSPIPPPPATTTATATTASGPATQISPTFPLGIPALDADPEAPPAGQAYLYFHSGEERVKIKLHDQTLLPMVVTEGALIVNQWRADDYLDFVAFTALVFGIAFELPMVMLVLAQIDIVQAKSFRTMRKYAYFGILIAAVIVAPSGDFLTLAFLFIPMILLYEAGIIVAAFATRHRPVED